VTAADDRHAQLPPADHFPPATRQVIRLEVRGRESWDHSAYESLFLKFKFKNSQWRPGARVRGCGQWREAGEPSAGYDDPASALGSRAEPLSTSPGHAILPSLVRGLNADRCRRVTPRTRSQRPERRWSPRLGARISKEGLVRVYEVELAQGTRKVHARWQGTKIASSRLVLP
jgi:hypothetical protein